MKTENNEKTNKQTLLNCLKLSLKFLAIAIIAVAYINVSIVVISPKFSAKIYSKLGLKSAEEYCLTRVYAKSDSLVDLYNLVVFEQNRDDLKQLQYINELKNKDGYLQFCKKMNSSALSSTTEKSLVAYVGDLDAYLTNQKVKCLYNLNLGAEVFVYTNLKSSELQEQSFATYVEIVKSDESQSAIEKKQKYQNLLDTFALGDDNLEIYLNQKMNAQEQKLLETDLGEAERILLQFSLMKNYKACYVVYDLIDETKKNEFKNKYESAVLSYNNLIK